MKKIILILNMMFSITLFSQIPKRYTVVATTFGGVVDTLDIDNYNKKPNIPPPVVRDKCVREGQQQQGCIFYDGEYSWTGVKSIDIIGITFFGNQSNKKIRKQQKEDYYPNIDRKKFRITHTYYWDYRLRRYVKLNIIRQR